MKNINKELASKLDYNEKVYLKDSSGNRYKIEVDYDYYPNNPREWDPVCHIMSTKRNLEIADEGLSFSKEDMMDMLDELKADPNVVVKPIYMYEHTGITIRLTPFGDLWDSSICGYIFAYKNEVIREIGNATEENWKERAENAMDHEIKVYDQFIRGDVYGFCVYQRDIIECKSTISGNIWTTEEWEQIDSCWGFYGHDFEENGLIEYALENLPDDIEIIEEED